MYYLVAFSPKCLILTRSLGSCYIKSVSQDHVLKTNTKQLRHPQVESKNNTKILGESRAYVCLFIFLQ